VKRVLVLLMLYACAAACRGQPTLRICIDAAGHPPMLTADHRGTIDLLIKMAADDIGLQLKYSVLPLARCQAELKAESQDAFSVIPFRPDLFPYLVLPLSNGAEDPSRSVVQARNMVFRRKGSTVEWDGNRFKHLRGPVLSVFGAPLVVARLKELGLTADDNGKTTEANFAKLAAGRGDVLIAVETDGLALMARPAFVGTIEMLPVPFTNANYYVGVIKAFAARHPGVPEQLWQAIGRVRESAAYSAAAKGILARHRLKQAAEATKQ
jgi:polar amino acid transport system substrate-binding protein